MAPLNPAGSQSYPPLKQPFQPKLQLIPSVRNIPNPFLLQSAPVPDRPMKDDGIAADGPSIDHNIIQKGQFHPQLSPRTLKTDVLFISALPVLVLLPLMVISSKFALSPPESAKTAFFARLAMLALQVCLVVGIARLLAKLRLAEPSLVRVSVEFCAGLFLFYVALLVLSSTRVSVLYFCLFASKWNVCTPLLFVYDLHAAFRISSAEIAPVFAGYVALIASFWFVQRASGVRGKKCAEMPLLAVCITGSFLLAGLFFTGAIAVPFWAITVAASALLLFMASHSHVSSKLNLFVVALFSYCLECFVLSTRSC